MRQQLQEHTIPSHPLIVWRSCIRAPFEPNFGDTRRCCIQVMTLVAVAVLLNHLTFSQKLSFSYLDLSAISVPHISATDFMALPASSTSSSTSSPPPSPPPSPLLHSIPSHYVCLEAPCFLVPSRRALVAGAVHMLLMTIKHSCVV